MGFIGFFTVFFFAVFFFGVAIQITPFPSRLMITMAL
jgi:hypothetical protein